MTAPLDFEEPEPIEASHLLKVRCSGCGAPGAALAAAGQERRARCTRCIGSSVTPPELAGWYQPVPRYGVGLVPADDREPRAAHPEPAVDSRSGVMGTPVGVVEDLASTARSALWAVDVTYAKGHGIHGGHGGVTGERESWAVRGVLGGRRFAAVHSVPGGWGSVWLIAPECGFFGAAGVTDLREWLRSGGARESEWYAKIRKRVAGQELARKVVRCPGAPRCVLAGPRKADGSAVLEGAHEHRASGAIKIKKMKAKQETGA